MEGLLLPKYYDNVQTNYNRDEYWVDIPIENQTLHMSFYWMEENNDTIRFSVYLTLANKRKQRESNEDHKRLTGKNPIRTVLTAREVFKSLVNYVCENNFDGFDYKKVGIYITWLDNRRRDAYAKGLSKLGYTYGKQPWDNKKCLFKIYKKEEPQEWDFT